jgi:tetratricopeptide (TPR) repeat protein
MLKIRKYLLVIYILHLIAIVVLVFGWKHQLHSKSLVAESKSLANEISSANLMSDQIPDMLKEARGMRAEVLEKISTNLGDQETNTEETIAITNKIAEGIDSTSTFLGIFMAFLTAGYGGVVFVAYLLPILAHRATHTVFDSGEILEKDPMAEARSKVAQGDYEGAIEAYRIASENDPENRMPWIEIVKIQRETLQQPQAAIHSIREALANYAWPENDASFFLFRLADLYQNDMQDLDTAARIMKQVIEQFPETRHSANARNKLQEWGMG